MTSAQELPKTTGGIPVTEELFTRAHDLWKAKEYYAYIATMHSEPIISAHERAENPDRDFKAEMIVGEVLKFIDNNVEYFEDFIPDPD